MKKVLPILMLLALFSMNNGMAQTIYMTQDFETGVIPVGWSQTTLASDGGWKFGTSLGSSSFPIAAHTTYACTNDDACNCNKSADRLITSAMDLSAASVVFISFDYQYYNGNYGGNQEVGTVEYSFDGGTTWTVAVTLPGVGAWTTGMFDISACAGHSNVLISFKYNDGGGWEYGWALDNLQIFTPVNYDLAVVSQNLQSLEQNNAAHTVSGTINNYGASTITSMTLNYSVNGGLAQVDGLTGLNITPLTGYNFSHNIAWQPTLAGNYTMKIWADNINGANADQNHPNDTLTATFQVIDSVQPKIVMFEEFTQASCDPCALAAPNVDSVIYNNYNVITPCRYHVNWPGTDYMNNETQTEVATRVTYYGVGGVPDGKLDGMDIYPGSGSFTTAAIQNQAAKGSIFKISLTSTRTFDDQFTVSADIKAYGDMPSGIKAYIILTDSMHYTNNQSTETIAQYDFPEVMQKMLPSTAGTTLAAFTSGQTQTVTANWAQNRPLATNFSTFPYDSGTWRAVIFIQNNATKEVYQSASAISLFTGIDEVSNSVSSFSVYPNPFSSNTNVAFSLKNTENVTMEVYNLLGEKVYSNDIGMMTQGIHVIPFNSSELSQGMYFMTIRAGSNAVTQKISILK